MGNDLNIKTKSSKVENEKTKSQDEELAKLKKAKEEADKKATELANAKKEVVKEENNNEELVNLAKSIIDSTKTNKKKTKITLGFFKGLLIGVIAGFLLATFLGFSGLFGGVGNDEVVNNEVIKDSLFNYTEVDFKNAILGEAQKKQELIVMEQPVKVSTTVTKSGLGKLEIFSKVKNIAYNGTGVYTVDMSKINNDTINVNLDNKKVTVYIPHSVLQYVNLDLENVEFEDTEKGLLAFGDLALTTEQQNEIEVSVKNTMSQTLNNKEFFDQADEFAKLKTWQIFQPLVSAVSNEFIVEMEFE